jgi:L-ascorbate metabolism protein UlaG (beta-lactamase superfamily)
MRRITWLGHASVLIESGGTRLLADPILRGRVAHLHRHVPVPSPLPAVDGVLISHVHHDHLDVPSLRAVANADAAVVLPVGARRHVRDLPFGSVHEVAAGTSVRVGALDVAVVPAWHEASRWPRFSPTLDALGFVADRIWFAGDTGLDPRMEELRGRVDVALVPIWGWGPSLGPGHLDPAAAARAVALVAPRIAIPIHWGTYLPYGLHRRHRHLLTLPARAFAAQVAESSPSVRVVTLSPGASFAPDAASAAAAT